jgi:hypothetical protein
MIRARIARRGARGTLAALVHRMTPRPRSLPGIGLLLAVGAVACGDAHDDSAPEQRVPIEHRPSLTPDSTHDTTVDPTTQGDAVTDVDTAADPDKPGLCGGVSLEPFEAGSRMDQAPEGLRALRARAQEALDTFAALNAEHHGNYSYVAFRSSWTGWSARITLTVRDGQVVRRAQQNYYADSWDGPMPIEDFVEEGEAVGTHESAAPAIGLPELYASCLDPYLCADPTDNYIYLATDAQGVLLNCGIFPADCEDDCYEGIELESVTFE